MYGVLFGDGQLEELVDVDAACIEYDELICYDANDNVVAKYPARGVMFGDIDVLRHIAPVFERLALKGQSVA